MITIEISYNSTTGRVTAPWGKARKTGPRSLINALREAREAHEHAKRLGSDGRAVVYVDGKAEDGLSVETMNDARDVIAVARGEAPDLFTAQMKRSGLAA